MSLKLQYSWMQLSSQGYVLVKFVQRRSARRYLSNQLMTFDASDSSYISRAASLSLQSLQLQSCRVVVSAFIASKIRVNHEASWLVSYMKSKYNASLS